ncbi:MAG: AAA family ATPase [Victivallales bacterium]|nr:AAA family ATPase [Victivallales bacterium]
MPQPILIDSSSFSEIRRKGCVYVDKTAYLHRLASGSNARFFLARPRRFGKSLMISTLKALFEGRRELFAGLAIEKTDWAWEKCPVMHFNFGFAAAPTDEEFSRSFPAAVRGAVEGAGGRYDSRETPSVNFGNAIDELSATNDGKGVVVLIDEYDDPVARLLHKPDEAEAVRERLAGFYGQMKDRTDKIRFLMITGVSKFTKMSVFSALSNLIDLSFMDDCATMLGYTEEELDAFFSEHLHAHAAIMGMDYGTYRAELKRWYNGYRFGRYSDATVYNPVSIGQNLAFPEPALSNYWTTTGKASMLMNFLRREEYLAVDLDNVKGVDETDFDVTNIRNLRTVPMLFQTGYLTIDKYDPLTQAYDLRVPDEEVRQDLAKLTTAYMAQQGTEWVVSLGKKLLLAKWDEFFAGLKALYAGLPYGSKEATVHEFAFERVLVTLLRSQSIQCRVEDRQADGQADVVAGHPCGIYLFELKVDESAESALRQISKKGYAEPYRADGRPVWLVGLNFDRKTRQLTDAKAEKLG